MKLKTSTLLASGLLLSLSSLPSHATLTAHSVNGANVVYDDIANITWLADANLLGTLFGSMGQSAVIQAIKAASPSITDGTGIVHTVVNKDFSNSYAGAASWYGAKAFVGYLNSINYAGSSVWTLPSAGISPVSGFNQTSGQFGQLFYNTLGGSANAGIPDTGYFTAESAAYHDDSSNDDEHADSHSEDDSASRTYWQDTELNNNLRKAWQFDMANGFQNTAKKSSAKSYIWAFVPGNLVSVPLPSAAWMMLSGVIGFLGLKRFRSNAG